MMNGTERFAVLSYLHSQEGKKFFKVECQQTKALYTMEVVPYENEDNVLDEISQTVLTFPLARNNPFCMGLKFFFECHQKRCYILDFVSERTLGSLVKERNRFTNNTVLFVAAELALALKAFHDRDLSYGELRVDTIMLNTVDGHVSLWREFHGKEYWDTSECLCSFREYECSNPLHKYGLNYGKQPSHSGGLVEEYLTRMKRDWHDLGTVLRAMLIGYKSQSQSSEGASFPKFVARPTKDLVKGLLDGTIHSFKDVEAHRCFTEMDWDAIRTMSHPSPLLLSIDENSSTTMTYNHQKPSTTASYRSSITEEPKQLTAGFPNSLVKPSTLRKSRSFNNARTHTRSPTMRIDHERPVRASYVSNDAVRETRSTTQREKGSGERLSHAKTTQDYQPYLQSLRESPTLRRRWSYSSLSEATQHTPSNIKHVSTSITPSVRTQYRSPVTAFHQTLREFPTLTRSLSYSNLSEATRNTHSNTSNHVSTSVIPSVMATTQYRSPVSVSHSHSLQKSSTLTRSWSYSNLSEATRNTHSNINHVLTSVTPRITTQYRSPVTASHSQNSREAPTLNRSWSYSNLREATRNTHSNTNHVSTSVTPRVTTQYRSPVTASRSQNSREAPTLNRSWSYSNLREATQRSYTKKTEASDQLGDLTHVQPNQKQSGTFAWTPIPSFEEFRQLRNRESLSKSNQHADVFRRDQYSSDTGAWCMDEEMSQSQRSPDFLCSQETAEKRRPSLSSNSVIQELLVKYGLAEKSMDATLNAGSSYRDNTNNIPCNNRVNTGHTCNTSSGGNMAVDASNVVSGNTNNIPCNNRVNTGHTSNTGSGGSMAVDASNVVNGNTNNIPCNNRVNTGHTCNTGSVGSMALDASNVVSGNSSETSRSSATIESEISNSKRRLLSIVDEFLASRRSRETTTASTREELAGVQGPVGERREHQAISAPMVMDCLENAYPQESCRESGQERIDENEVFIKEELSEGNRGGNSGRVEVNTSTTNTPANVIANTSGNTLANTSTNLDEAVLLVGEQEIKVSSSETYKNNEQQVTLDKADPGKQLSDARTPAKTRHRTRRGKSRKAKSRKSKEHSSPTRQEHRVVSLSVAHTPPTIALQEPSSDDASSLLDPLPESVVVMTSEEMVPSRYVTSQHVRSSAESSGTMSSPPVSSLSAGTSVMTSLLMTSPANISSSMMSSCVTSSSSSMTSSLMTSPSMTSSSNVSSSMMSSTAVVPEVVVPELVEPSGSPMSVHVVYQDPFCDQITEDSNSGGFFLRRRSSNNLESEGTLGVHRMAYRASSLLSLTESVTSWEDFNDSEFPRQEGCLSRTDSSLSVSDVRFHESENKTSSITRRDSYLNAVAHCSRTENTRSSPLSHRENSFMSHTSMDSGSLHFEFPDVDGDVDGDDVDDVFCNDDVCSDERSETEIKRNDSGLGDEIAVTSYPVQKRLEDIVGDSSRQWSIVASSARFWREKTTRKKEMCLTTQQEKYGGKESDGSKSSLVRDSCSMLCPDCGCQFFSEKNKPSVLSEVSKLSLICSKCQNNRVERKEAIIELVHTEKNYGNDFRILKEEFLSPMQRGGIVSADNLGKIFLNIQELLDVSTRLCQRIESSMQECIREDDEEFCHMKVGKIFVDNMEFLKAYELYCSKQPEAASLLESSQKKNEVLKIFLNITCRENPKCWKMDIKSFLLAPVQRVMKYPLMLSRVRKATPCWHDDREDLKIAQRKVEEQITKINSLTKSREVKTRKLSSARLDSVDSERLKKLACNVLGWTMDETQLLMNGVLMVSWGEFGESQRSWTKRVRKRSLKTHALFCIRGQNEPITVDSDDDDNDGILRFPGVSEVSDASLLLLKRKSNGKYTLFRDEIRLRDCVVYKEEENNSFGVIQMGKEVFVFTAQTAGDARKWLKHLRLQAKDQGKWRRRRNASANIMLKTS